MEQEPLTSGPGGFLRGSPRGQGNWVADNHPVTQSIGALRGRVGFPGGGRATTFGKFVGMSGRDIAVAFLEQEADRRGQQADQQAQEARSRMRPEEIQRPNRLDQEADLLIECATQFRDLPEGHPSVRQLDANLRAVQGDEKAFLKWIAQLVRRETGIDIGFDQ
jgi:hypothetical protein